MEVPSLDLLSWPVILFSVVLVGIVLFLKYLRRNDNYWKDRGVHYVPRASAYQILKVMFSKPMHQAFLEEYYKNGKLFGGFEGTKPFLVVAEPDLLKNVLVKDFFAFGNRREFDFGDSMMGKMVSVLTGEDWKRVRSTISPAFTSKKMRKMTNIINDCVKTVIRTFDEHCEKGVSADCKRIFGAFTMDVIASAAFATKIDSHQDPDNVFAQRAREMFKPSIIRLLVFLFAPLWLVKKVGMLDNKGIDFFQAVTLQVIEERKKKGHRSNDFLQLMIDASDELVEAEKQVNGFKTIEVKDDEEDHFGSVSSNVTSAAITNKRLSQNEIVAQCVLFFIVGYETTASTLAFTAYNLAINPECQEKLIKEVDEAFQNNEEMTYDVLPNMKYLDSTISETLRIFPPLLMSERTASEDYKLGDTGITVPKGMLVRFPIYGMHMDEEFFPEPKKFDPERFMGENRQNLPQYAYLPFGAGPRNCLGMRFALMEIKLCISNILRKYRFQPCAETKIPMEFKIMQGFLSVPHLPLALVKRTDVIPK